MYLGIVSETFAQASHTWLASAHGTDATRSISLTVALFTSGTHYPNGHLPDGLPLGRVDADGTFGPYSEVATDGRDTLAGFLFMPIPVPTGATHVAGALLDHGKVITANLPIAVGVDAAYDARMFVFVDTAPPEVS